MTVVIGLGAAVLVLIALSAAVASHSVAREQALDEAERTTRRMADLVVAPLLAGYVAHDRDDADDLVEAVRVRKADGYLDDVVVWSDDGTVVFSDRPEEVGRRPQPTPRNVAAALAGRTTSMLEDDAPEPRRVGGTEDDQDGPPRYVDVVVPLRVAGLTPLALEAYYDYDRVDRVADDLLRQSLPLVVVPLLTLQLVQVPIVVSLARRLVRHEAERARLLERALSASDRERARLSADLHDGPIQDLAGLGYAVGAIAPDVPERHRALMAQVQQTLREAVENLRGLMADLYPPHLGGAGLDEALATLVAPLREAGTDVTLHVGELGPLGDDTTVALYRVAREALANVTKHARASHVEVSAERVPPAHGRGLVRLEVGDDGAGIDPARLHRRRDEHLGLRLVGDQVAALGGRLSVAPRPGGGTRVHVELPVGEVGEGVPKPP
ncbi:sensor histidine kinase [Microlunatus flavus]|uniref:sensor histidine kinase n=1 Tax=Microlunatus flavus TaxID=1036181 RepID=UPI00111354AD|nr:sensor histidine kinase [Microlunatus flavus]